MPSMASFNNIFYVKTIFGMNYDWLRQNYGSNNCTMSAASKNERIKKGPPRMGWPFSLYDAWRCPTLTWGDPTLPSALSGFTSEFGMGSGGSHSLWSSGKLWMHQPFGWPPLTLWQSDEWRLCSFNVYALYTNFCISVQSIACPS